MDEFKRERGRGKFKPAPNLSPEEVREVLLEKIEEERDIYIEDNDFTQDELTYNPDKFNVTSLFAGAGGLDLGVELAGLDAVIGEETTNETYRERDTFEAVRHESIFHKVYANDFFKEALETYKNCFPESVYVHHKDIRRVREFPTANIVLGGFPCPGFSEAGPRLVDDERNFLYIHYIRCLMQTQPEIFIAENVKGMLTLGGGEAYRQIKQDFEAAGYRVFDKLVNARDYGVPQLRERVFLVGVRQDLDFEYHFPEPTHGNGEGLLPYVTLREAIGDLEENPGPYFTGSYSTIFMSRNRKKSWDEQSFTIQASGRQAPIHPGGLPMLKLGENEWIFQEGEENNRRLSINEIKRIQTFPEWYEFETSNSPRLAENSKLDKIYKQIGNAVPVELARAIARPIAEWAVTRMQGERTERDQIRLGI
ncbi:DNA cytosine methyltransferase [Neobacillus pocheonensis]|uniref:Cytosine-specific methyltransferase n=1 Tax=Neobacillus pocheonensis TaxID=363869 RepID=A0ABT0WFR5_9BACI|nr:DNA cytosine methyltransferase [Neobacillus pocheonensis]